MAKDGWKRIGRRLLAAALGLVLALVGIELGFRVWAYGPRGLSPAWMNSVAPLGFSGLLRVPEHPDLRYQLKPDLRARFKMAHFDTDSAGLRDEPVALEKPPGTFRIAVLGDSFTMGSGVELEDAYHSVLERLLEREPGGMRFECLNFGVGGYSLPEYTAVLRHLVPRYDVDLVLVALTASDRLAENGPRGEYVPRPVAKPFYDWTSYRALRESIQRARRPELARGTEAPWTVPADEAPPDPGVARFLSGAMTELAALAREQGLPVLVVHLRCGAPGDGREMRVSRAFRVACEEAGLPFHDAARRFAGHHPRDFAIFYDDMHPNAEGHALLAEEIHAALVASGLLDGRRGE